VSAAMNVFVVCFGNMLGRLDYLPICPPLNLTLNKSLSQFTLGAYSRDLELTNYRAGLDV
jgi:hypothetical protein